MNRAVILESPDWRVTSHGNALAYEIVNKRLKRSLFFQGDDAAQFWSEFDSLTNGRPALNDADALTAIWSDYGHLSEPWEPC